MSRRRRCVSRMARAQLADIDAQLAEMQVDSAGRFHS